jgi:hypothetical protein
MMRKWQVNQYQIGSAAYVIAHAKRNSQRGKQAAIPYRGFTNPRLALAHARHTQKHAINKAVILIMQYLIARPKLYALTKAELSDNAEYNMDDRYADCIIDQIARILAFDDQYHDICWQIHQEFELKPGKMPELENLRIFPDIKYHGDISQIIQKVIFTLIKLQYIPGFHHKIYIIDQALNQLTGEQYRDIKKLTLSQQDSRCPITWDEGICP